MISDIEKKQEQQYYLLLSKQSKGEGYCGWDTPSHDGYSSHGGFLPTFNQVILHFENSFFYSVRMFFLDPKLSVLTSNFQIYKV